MFPNDPSAHFCKKCGAPLSSYASTAPFEHIFAEGHAYRQAAEQPRRLIVVLGIWVIFGTTATAGIAFIALGKGGGFVRLLIGTCLIAVSLTMIWKTTRNYLLFKKTEEKR